MEIKLEEEENHKGLILDPQRDHHLHLYKQLLDSTKQLPTAGGGSTFHGLHQHHDQLQQQTHAGVAAAAAGGSTAPPHPPQPQNNNNNNKRSYSSSFEYAPEKMGESYQFHNQQLQQNQQPTGSSRLRNTGGEIVEVQGGHIVRSTGRKDRHSKVCTAKGPRDRRVRLSAHTAIQFYDVQDRLGYDRPSKAVDWLIKKAKSAIDELAELPAWKPTATPVPRNANPNSSIVNFDPNPEQLGQFEQHPDDNIVDSQMGRSQNSSFLPPSLDSDSIADTIKSFFPMGASSNPANNNNNNSSSGMQFHQSFTPSDLISRGSNTNSNRSQDLRLSLQSFQDPILQNHHHQQGDSNSNNNNMYFDGSGWPDTPSGGFQRMVTWGGDAVFSSQPTTQFLQPLFAQNQTQTQTTNNHQLFNNNSQRGPLQSSTAPSFRAWIDPPPPFTGVAIDQHPTLSFHHPSNMPVFASGLGGFSGFRVPARIQGQEEEHDGISDRPSSASSDSHH